MLQSNSTALTVENISYTYPDSKKPTLHDISFQVNTAEIFGILGTNGAGKSTLLDICTGWLKADKGEIKIFKHPLQANNLTEIKEMLGVMPQAGGSYPGMTVQELLTLIGSYYKHPLPVTTLLNIFSLQKVSNKTYKKISFGQKQRLSLACAVIGRPKLLFLDEPTAGLDPLAQNKVLYLLKRMKKFGVTIILSTHDLEELNEIADSIIMLHEGKIVAAGNLSTLLADSPTEIRFSGTENFNLSNLINSELAGIKWLEVQPGKYLLKNVNNATQIETIKKWKNIAEINLKNLKIGEKSLTDLFIENTNLEKPHE